MYHKRKCGRESHPSAYTLLTGEKRRVDSPLSVRDKLRNHRIRQKRMKRGRKDTRLIEILRSYSV
jgi:hypothetical protein